MEKGFFHPARGYWQAIGGGDLSRYPEGTIEVPLKPGPQHEWDGAKWVNVPPSAAEAQAKAAKDARKNAARAKLTAATGMTIEEIKTALEGAE